MSITHRAVIFVSLSAAPLFVAAQQSPTTAPVEAPEPLAVQRMQTEAADLLPQMTTALGREFLDAAANLPTIAPRTIYRDKKSRQWFSRKQMDEVKAADATIEFEEMAADEGRYYDTKYGTPIAYARLFNVLGGDSTSRESLAGAKILDIGYGTIGHLRMLASRGAQVTGLDVDSFLTALYSEPTDTGDIKNVSGGANGSITLVSGRVNDPRIVEQITEAGEGGYDFIVSKNTLKRGYVNPPKDVKVDKRMLIDLGVDDETFLKTLFAMLKPGGHVMIYNISGKQNDYKNGEQYLPMADGLCPYDTALLEKVGFKSVILDQDDSANVRKMAIVFGWDQDPNAMNLEDDLFAHYSLLQKPNN